jgi:hypothetical protein
MGDFKSFFEFLFDLHLEGKELPTPEEIWTEMKKQLNYAQGNLLKASDDYRKIQNTVRHQQSDLQERMKEAVISEIATNPGIDLYHRVYFKDGKTIIVKELSNDLILSLDQLNLTYDKLETVSKTGLTDEEAKILNTKKG